VPGSLQLPPCLPAGAWHRSTPTTTRCSRGSLTWPAPWWRRSRLRRTWPGIAEHGIRPPGRADPGLQRQRRCTSAAVRTISTNWPTASARCSCWRSTSPRCWHDWMRAWFTTTRPISGTPASTCAASCPVLQDRLRASGAIPVDARQPLDQVVDALLSRSCQYHSRARPTAPAPVPGAGNPRLAAVFTSAGAFGHSGPRPMIDLRFPWRGGPPTGRFAPRRCACRL
jgi:hypothetical protein